jgi:DNA-binding SARP family transcriptional activator
MPANMINVVTLGGLTITNANQAVAKSLEAQPRRAAIFIYLLVESRGGRGISRDRVASMFWPEVDPERASHALSQALVHIRSSLGESVFTGKGTSEVGVSADVVNADAVRFRNAIAARAWAEAADLYRGEFLDGFTLDEPGDFERWLEEERAWYRRQAATACGALAELSIQRGQLIDASAWARRAVEYTSQDEREVRRLIRVLDSIGDRAGALAAYTALRRELQEFGAVPSDETQALVASFSRSADVAATVERKVAPPPAEDHAPEPHPAPPGPSGAVGQTPSAAPAPASPTLTRFARRPLLVALSLLLGIAFAGLWAMKANRKPAEASDINVSIQDVTSSNPADANSREQLTAALYRHLQSGEHFRVMAPTTTSGIASTYELRVRLVKGARGELADALLVDSRTGEAIRSATISPVSDADSAAHSIAVFTRKSIASQVDLHRVEQLSDNAMFREAIRESFRLRSSADSLRAHGLYEPADMRMRQADAMLVDAARVVSDPILLEERAQIAYDRMWLYIVPGHFDMAEARRIIRSGIAYSSDALKAANHPAALELRGRLYYWLAQTGSNDSLAARIAQRDSAENDLRRAVAAEPRLAGAWSLVSAIMYGRGSYQDAYITAERAYSADVYSQDATEILLRLVDSGLESGDLIGARKWCSELRYVHGTSYEHSYCSLKTLAWGPAASDSAYAIAKHHAAVSTSDCMRKNSLQTLLAIVKQRRGEKQDAAAVYAQTRTCPSPGLLPFTAWFAAEMHDRNAARSFLDEYVRKVPFQNDAVLRSTRFAQ